MDLAAGYLKSSVRRGSRIWVGGGGGGKRDFADTVQWSRGGGGKNFGLKIRGLPPPPRSAHECTIVFDEIIDGMHF